MADGSKQPDRLALSDGHQLAISEDGSLLTLTNLKGLTLQLRLTAEGPVLEFDAPQVTLRNKGDLCLDAQNIHLKTQGDLVQEVGGNLLQKTSGHHRIAARDDIRVEAQGLSIEAMQGELELKASDDVALEGLRILHNVPREEDIAAAKAKVRTFGEYMSVPALDPNSPKRLPRSEPRPNPDWKP